MVSLLVAKPGNRLKALAFFLAVICCWTCCLALATAVGNIKTLHSNSNDYDINNRIRFRAYCASTQQQQTGSFHYRTRLHEEIRRNQDMELLSDGNAQCNASSSNYVEFEVSREYFSPERNDRSFLLDNLHSLPASKVCIVVAAAESLTAVGERLTTRHASSPSVSCALSMRVFLEVWTTLGNVLPENENDISFEVICKKTKQPVTKKRGRHRHHHTLIATTKDPMRRIAKSLEETYGWTAYVAESGLPVLSFQVLIPEQETDDNNGSSISVECPVLTRTWPLLDPTRKSSRKRLESFLVAKSADIQRQDVVWDPMCKRGTLLVEAAKYWPLAHYHGLDSSLGHLEHVHMNAESTKTRISLHEGKPDHLPVKDDTVDKIMTCIVSLLENRSNRDCHKVLSDWACALKVGGTMNLVVNKECVRKFASVIPSNCRFSFIRSPSFRWGTGRATIVVVEKTGPTAMDQSPSNHQEYPSGLFDWEKSSKEGTSRLGRIRAETVPQLVPIVAAKLQSQNTEH